MSVAASLDGTVYLYTGHDEDLLVNNFYKMNEWRVYSSTDMVNWTDHGSPMSYHTFAWATGDAWAAQPIFRNGKFYYYAPMTSSSLGRMVIGVGVSDSPPGPFTDVPGAGCACRSSPGRNDTAPALLLLPCLATLARRRRLVRGGAITWRTCRTSHPLN